MAAPGPAHLRAYVPRLLTAWPLDEGATPFQLVEGTLLSADLSGFTALSERLASLGREGAEELTTLLNTCFSGMIAEVERWGGDILKFGGDALLILYRGPAHTERACRSAVAMRDFVTRPLQSRNAGKVQLRISQGMHAGEFAFYVVDAGHVELVVTGPAATETVECEGIADAGEILLSPAAAHLVPPGWLGEPKEGRRLLATTSGTTVAPHVDASPEVAIDRFLPPAQLGQILIGAPPEHRRITVGFLKFSHTDHEELEHGRAHVAALLQRLSTIVAKAADDNGVHWMATDIAPDGGKIILAAGAPVASEEDEERMLRAARAIVDQADGLDVRIGVNYGPVFVGDLGGPTRRAFTVMGDAVNLAARLMTKADTHEVVASRSTLNRTRARFATTPLEPFFVKGKSIPIDAALVGDLEGRSADVEQSTTLPLIGRAAELAIVNRLVDRTRAGHGAVVEIVGEAGAGKSRLVEEVHQTTELLSLTVICGQYSRSSAYFVLRVLLRTLVGVTVNTPARETGEALTKWVLEVAPDLERWIPLVANAIDAEVPDTPEAAGIAPAYRRSRTHEVIADLLTTAVTEPAMLVVEDAHWMDEASREVLASLGQLAGQRPWLLCFTRRSGSQIVEESTVIELEPLDAEVALELAVAAAGQEQQLRPDDWDRLVARSAGNPMFLIELVSTAIEHGSSEGLPESVETVVTSRLDTLAPADRLLLREAAVLGMVVDLDLLATALESDEIRLTDRWAALDPFLIDLGPDALQFRHGLYRQVAYEGLSFGRRRDMHRRIGQALEERAGADPLQVAELLSTHFHHAAFHEKAWRYSVAAGDRARAKWANLEATEFYQRAIENAQAMKGVPKEDVAVVCESLGDVTELAGRYDDASHAYRKARKLVPPTGRRQARLLHKEGVLRERTGRYPLALSWYSRALKGLGEADGPDKHALRARLCLAYAGVRHRQGLYAEQVRWAAIAAEEARLGDVRASLAHAYYLTDLGNVALGRPEQFPGMALPIYEELGDFVGQGNVLNNRGIRAYHEGRWNEAIDSYRRARTAADRAGNVIGVATYENNLAEILSDQGKPDEAVPIFRKALRVFRSARYPVGVAVVTANIGRAEARLGDHAKALELLEAARTTFEELGAKGFIYDTTARIAECLVLAGRVDEAVRVVDTLVPALQSEGDELAKVLVERVRGWVCALQGDEATAVTCLRESGRRAVGINATYEQAVSDLSLSVLVRGDEGRALALSAAETFEHLDVVAVQALPDLVTAAAPRPAR
jgi:class 3 adenylate cyclase/tetratricopeptide (TPR) repeat protein